MKMKKLVCHKIFILLAVIPVTPNLSVFSQGLRDTFNISAVEIYAVRPLESTGINKTKMDSLALREKANLSLAELLSEHTHIFIKTYGRGAMASASFRGTAPSHTKVTWNGIELNSPMLGMVDFSIIPVSFIDNVELYHGSSSVSKTTGALGGLVSLSTQPDWNDNFSFSILQGIGSFGTYDTNIKTEAGKHKFKSQTRLFYSHSDNDFRYENTDIIDSVNLETGEKHHPSAINRDGWYTNYGLLQEFHLRPSEKDIFSLSFWGQESSRSIPQLSTDEAGINTNVNRDESEILRGLASYKRYLPSGHLKLLTGINYTYGTYKLYNRLPDNSVMNELNSESLTMSINNHLEFAFGLEDELHLNIAADLDVHKVHSVEKVRDFGYDKNRIQPGLSGSAFKIWNHRWRSNLILTAEMADHILLPLIYNAGLEYHILQEDQLYIRTALAGNSRYPTLNDLYFQPGGNPSLKPERSHNQELGIHFDKKSGRIHIEGDVSGYNSVVSNWILWLPTFKGYWAPENVKKVTNRGLETSFGVSLDETVVRFRILGTYSYTKSVNRGDPLNPGDKSYGNQLPYIPVHSGNLYTAFMIGSWTFHYLWNYYSQRFTTSSNQLTSRRDYLYPYFMNQAGISKQLNTDRIQTEINLKIHNLFDEKYRSVLQRPMPGRNFTLLLKLKF
jgi:iron complex outermembrane receptor protein